MKKVIGFLLALVFSFSILAGCGKKDNRVEDTRQINDHQYTTMNVTATDKEGRTVTMADSEIDDRYVGLFYHIWHGYHTNGYPEVYDITKLLAEDEEAFWDLNNKRGYGKFHYWGEPLYGYYCSDDPYVITKHIELLTMAGVDYLVYDTTNTVVYTKAIEEIFKKLEFFKNQGWDVPKVAFYTNTNSMTTIQNIYNKWYKEGKYQDLWFSFNDKPLIIGALGQDEGGVMSREEVERLNAEYQEFFDFRISTWPYIDQIKDRERGFPWMDWEYPQSYFNGTMSVSLAQHPGARMSNKEMSNNGRGFDYNTFKNDPSKVNTGANYEGQWQSVFDFNKEHTDKKVNNVFITGWNEWIAIKQSDGTSYFTVDTFNEEYSRDIEMMRGGYDDNYYLQTVGKIRGFKYSPYKSYRTVENKIDIDDDTFAGWKNCRNHYKDFVGDTIERDFRDAINQYRYIDKSGRNDITDVWLAHDSNNLYIKVDTADTITSPQGENWMNVLIGTDVGGASFNNFQYILNRHPDGKTTSVEKSKGGFEWESAGEAQLRVYDKTMVIAVPLSALGLNKNNVKISIKVADNIENPHDIMDYYVTGDSAPIGRLAYAYNY